MYYKLHMLVVQKPNQVACARIEHQFYKELSTHYNTSCLQKSMPTKTPHTPHIQKLATT
jgi:hypothetical protein